MAGQRLVLGPYFNEGDLLTDCKLYHYAVGTSDLKNIYSDKALTTAAAQPLACDANGLFTFFAAGEYKFVLTLANDTPINTWDQWTISGVGVGDTTTIVEDYGAVGDGDTDDTVAIQAAADAAGLGGCLEFTAGKVYTTIRNVVLKSRTLVKGNNASLKQHETLWVGHIDTNDGYLLRNENHGINDIPDTISSLTDEDIYIHDLNFIQNAYAAGTGQIAVGMRYVDRAQVLGCTSTGGGNFTGFLACQDTFTGHCYTTNWGNAAYDHWDGAGTATVAYCTARNDRDCAQGIQFTGTGSFGENRTSSNCLAIGNRVFGVRHSTANTASAIIFNANDADSAVFNAVSMNNYIYDSDIGVAFTGDGGYHQSINDVLEEVTKTPLFMQHDDGDSPGNCSFINPTLIDCEATGVGALMVLTGVEPVVRCPKVINTVSAGYAYLVWVASTATNAVVDVSTVVSADDGTSGRILNSGTGTRIMGEGVAYTPTLAFGGASAGLSYTSRSSHYTRNGDVVFYCGQIIVNSNGSSTGQPTISLPLTASGNTVNGVINVSIVGASGLTSPVLGVITTDGTTMLLWDYGATGAVAIDESNIPDSAAISWSGSYRVEV